MNARSLLVALFCVSCVCAYGPLFILQMGQPLEQYYGSNMNNEDVEEIIKNSGMEVVRIIFNPTEEISVKPYYMSFVTREVIPHYIDDLNAEQSVVVSTLEELEKVDVKNKLVVLEVRQGENYVAPSKTVLEDSGRGVYMTPSVLMALLVIVTLALGLYIAVDCIDQVQTPTAYTHDNLAVGKEF